MKTDLDHLPPPRQSHLRSVVRVLLEEFQKRTAQATQPWTRHGRILKIVLYGSFARGDWVDDRRSGYLSDYDILVVVNHAKLTDKAEYWEAAEDRLLRSGITTPRFPTVNVIVHDHADVNDQIARGRPFFLDIVRDGIMLYEAPGFPFAKPGNLFPDIVREETVLHFENWSSYAESALLSTSAITRLGLQRDAAFMSHQAAERAYTCVLLTLTLYSPQEHNIRKLRTRAESLAPELRAVWPPADRLSRRCFELIKDSYIKARYSKHYRITDEELAYSFARLEELLTRVKAVCERHIASLEHRA